MDSLRCTRDGTGRSLATPTRRRRPRHGGLPGFLQRHGAKIDLARSGSTAFRSAMRKRALHSTMPAKADPGLRDGLLGRRADAVSPDMGAAVADELQQGAAALQRALAMDAKTERDAAISTPSRCSIRIGGRSITRRGPRITSGFGRSLRPQSQRRRSREFSTLCSS